LCGSCLKHQQSDEQNREGLKFCHAGIGL
jgi:hypothetical protein